MFGGVPQSAGGCPVSVYSDVGSHRVLWGLSNRVCTLMCGVLIYLIGGVKLSVYSDVGGVSQSAGGCLIECVLSCGVSTHPT